MSCVEIIDKHLPVFNDRQINVACFIDPDLKQIKILKQIGIKYVEFHTGRYASAINKTDIELHFQELKKAIEYSDQIGFTCHAGHGLDFNNVSKIASIKQIKELNIGHFLIGESIFYGFQDTILKMRELIDVARLWFMELEQT